MLTNVVNFCKSCIACQTRRNPVPAYQALLKPINVSRPFEKVAADIATVTLPITSRGSRYLLVVSDYFTKYFNLYAVKDQTASSVTDCTFKHYILKRTWNSWKYSHRPRRTVRSCTCARSLCKTRNCQNKNNHVSPPIRWHGRTIEQNN